MFALFGVLIAMGVLNVLALVYGWQNLERDVEQMRDWNLATDIGERLMPMLTAGVEGEHIERYLEQFYAFSGQREFYLLDESGVVLYAMPTEIRGLRVSRIDPDLLAKASGVVTPPLPLYGPDPVTGRPAVFSLGKTKIAGSPAWLYVVLDSRNRTVLGERAGQIYLVVFGIVMSALAALLVGLSAYILFSFLSRNFRNAVSAVREIAAGNLSRRLPVHGDDEIAEFSAVVNEMADRLVAALEQVQHTDQMRRGFVAAISHDLRTPLTVIEGYVDLLRNSGDSLEPAKRDRALELIAKNVTSQKRLVDDLFFLSRLEARERAPEMGPFSLAELAYDVIEKLRAKAGAKQITLAFQADERASAAVGDIDLIERVITNLCENAIRYSPEGSTVTVTCAVPSTGATDGVELAVLDTGIGIDSAEVAKLGEPFFRATSARTTEASGHTVNAESGTGLGLAIVKKILESHGSILRVRSELGVGSTFSFVLPSN